MGGQGHCPPSPHTVPLSPPSPHTVPIPAPCLAGRGLQGPPQELSWPRPQVSGNISRSPFSLAAAQTKQLPWPRHITIAAGTAQGGTAWACLVPGTAPGTRASRITPVPSAPAPAAPPPSLAGPAWVCPPKVPSLQPLAHRSDRSQLSPVRGTEPWPTAAPSPALSLPS